MSERTLKKSPLANTIVKIFVGAFTVLYLLPVYWIIVTSFKPEMKALTWPPQFIPSKVMLDNYKVAFEFKSVFWYMQNSLIISIGSVLVSIVVGGIAANSFAQMEWQRKTKKNILLWIVSLKIMPPIAVAIPLFLIFASLKLIDTYAGVIYAYIFFNLPFVIWLLYGFFKELPREIVEAAFIDGCSVFIIDRGLLWGQLCAVGTIAVIPVIIVALFIQKYIVSGLTFGAVK